MNNNNRGNNALPQVPRGHRRHRYRPGTAALRMGTGIGNEEIPQLVRPHVHEQRRMDQIIAPRRVERQQVPAARNNFTPRVEVPEEVVFVNPAMEAVVLDALNEAKTQSARNIRLFGEKVYAVYKRDGLNVTVETLSRFLADLASEESFLFWNGGNTISIIRLFGYLFKRINGLRLAWNGEFHRVLAYLDSDKMEYLSRLYIAGLKKKVILPHAALWSNVVGDWSPSLSVFFASLFQKLYSTFTQPVLARKLNEWGIIELITNGPGFVEKLNLAMERFPARETVINMIKRLCDEMLIDMTSAVLKDDPDFLENLIISKAENCGYSNRQLVEMIWSGILKRVKGTRVRENQIRVFSNIPRILAAREELRSYIQVVKLEFFRAMYFSQDLAFLMEEMNTFVGSCLHHGIIKVLDIHTWKISSDRPLFNSDNPCHCFLLEIDLNGM